MFHKSKAIMMFVVAAVVVMATPALASAELGDRTLNKGDRGSDVVELQNYLLTKGVFPYHTATGYYGEITEEAVKDFQESRNLKEDGIAGPNTNHAIKVLRYGDIGKQVIHIQSQLAKTGHHSSGLDGVYGNGTKDSVKSFQRAEGLTVDGIAGPSTRSELNRAASKSTAAGKELTVESTAYTAECEGCSGVTRMGVNLKKYSDGNVIAVDPDVIPLGSIVEVEGYGRAIAADTGGAINGKKIDVFIEDQDEAMDWGRKDVKVKVIK